MNSENSESKVQPESADVPEPKRSSWRTFLSVVGVIALLFCLCIGVLTLFGPALGKTMNNIMGVPNGAPE